MKKLAMAALAAATLSAVPAFAQQAQQPWYVGIGAGTGNLNMSGTELTGLSNARVDDTSSTFTIRGGYRFHPNFAVELGYYDLGKYDFGGSVGTTSVTGSAKAKSYGISLVGIAPLGQFDLYGRLGWADSELKANAGTNLVSANSIDRQGEATYGVGGRWNFTKEIGLFAEWMKNDKIKVDSYMAGIDFRF